MKATLIDERYAVMEMLEPTFRSTIRRISNGSTSTYELTDCDVVECLSWVTRHSSAEVDVELWVQVPSDLAQGFVGISLIYTILGSSIESGADIG